MDYKPFITKRQDESLSTLAISLKRKYDIIIFNDHPKTFDIDDILHLVNSRISSIFNPKNQTAEDMFIYQEPKFIELILDNLIELLISQEIELTFEQISEFLYFEFVCWILTIYEEENIIPKAILIFNQLYKMTDKCNAYFSSVPLVYNYLESNNPHILDAIGILLDLVFQSSMQNAIELIRNEEIMSRLLRIAKYSLNIYRFFRDLLQEAIFTEEFGKNVDPLLIKAIIHISIANLTNKVDIKLTEITIHIFQILSFNPNTLMMALNEGLENYMIRAMGIQSPSNVLLFYTIIRNIFRFVINGEIKKTNLIQLESFYTKTAEMIKFYKNDEDLEIVFTTIGYLGYDFWEHFIRLGILESVLEYFPEFSYANKKSITSILLRFFMQSNANFRRERCIPPIIEIFMEMLNDEDDDEFVLEIIHNLILILKADETFFSSIFGELDIEESFAELANSENEKIAETAQNAINELHGC